MRVEVHAWEGRDPQAVAELVAINAVSDRQALVTTGGCVPTLLIVEVPYVASSGGNSAPTRASLTRRLSRGLSGQSLRARTIATEHGRSPGRQLQPFDNPLGGREGSKDFSGIAPLEP